MAATSSNHHRFKKQRSESWIGHRIGRLEIVAFEGIKRFNGGGRSAYFTFRCDCGAEFSSQKSNVVRSGALDCGCSKHTRPVTYPSGYTNHPYAKVWNGIHERCSSANSKSYPNYGGRGITVCDRWTKGDGSLTGFECFVLDMGSRPEGFTIERRDYNGNYEPGNCSWISKPDQGKNCRGVRIVEIDGVTKTLPDWCSQFGIKYFTAHQRLKRGMSPLEALTTPVSR